ncbi:MULTISPECIES: hypothetical protein [unclassified Aeromicrobium]|uniref:hypothetical protein n=1 Tax=unclassified Aeromicrobium TaxID=2633570 RepID=UPI00396B3373
MPDRRPDLRLDAPTLEPSDDLVFRLAMAARSNASPAPTRSRGRRLALVVGSFLGVSVISVGGAWAVGAIDVPLLPSSPLRDAIVTPSDPTPQDRQDGAPTPAEGADQSPAGKVVTSSGGDGAAEKADVSGRSAADPTPKDQGSTDAPVDPPAAKDRGQGDTRSQDKGDNGQHRGQDKDPSERGSSEQAHERGNGNGSGNGNGNGTDKPAKPEKDQKAQGVDE